MISNYGTVPLIGLGVQGYKLVFAVPKGSRAIITHTHRGKGGQRERERELAAV